MNSSSGPYDNIFLSPSPPENALPGAEPQSGESYPASGTFSRSSDIASNSENLPRNNNEMMDLGSHRQINRAALQGRLSYDTIGQQLRREPLPADSLPAAIPATGSRSRQGTALRRETRELNVDPDARSRHDRLPSGAGSPQRAPARPISTSKSCSAPSRREARAVQDEGITGPGPILSSTSMQPHMRSRHIPPVTRAVPPSRILQEAGNDISLGLPRTAEQERNRYPFLQDSPREKSLIRPSVGAEQVARTGSVQPPAYSSPSLIRPSISTSPSHPAPTLTRTASNWRHIPQRRLPEEFQARFRGAPSESHYPPDEDKGNEPTDEQGRKNPSDTAIRPPQPAEHTVPSDPLSWHESESHSRRLGRGNSRIRGDERANREANRAPRAPGPGREREPPIAREERGTRTEDSVTTLGGSQRLRVEPNPTVTHASGLTSYLITPPDSPVVAGDYRDPNHESGRSTTRLHDSNSGGSRGKPELPRALPALIPDRPEPLITPPPPALLSMQDKHKLVVDVPTNIDSEVSNVGPQLGRLTSAGSTFPPNFTQPVMRSHSASVPPIPQNKRSTRTLRDPGDDIPRLPDGYEETHEETHASPRILVDAPYETFEHRPHAEPNDPMGLVQPGSETEVREERESQAQHGSVLSHAPYENKRIPITDEQHHADHLQKMLFPELTNITDMSASQHLSQPFIGRYETSSSPGSLPIHFGSTTKQASASNLDNATFLQERALNRDSSSSSVPEDGPPSKPSGGVPSKVRDKPITSQPKSVERHHPLVNGIQQGAGPRAPSGPSGDAHPIQRRRPPGGGKPPRDEPPEQTEGGWMLRGGGRQLNAAVSAPPEGGDPPGGGGTMEEDELPDKLRGSGERDRPPQPDVGGSSPAPSYVINIFCCCFKGTQPG